MLTVCRAMRELPMWLCTIVVFSSLPGVSFAGEGEQAKSESEMKAYTQDIPGTGFKFDVVAIPAGEFLIGSPETEADRSDDEGPQRKVKIAPFWMGKTEVTWDEYGLWAYGLDIKKRQFESRDATDTDKIADVVTKPTKPYTDMTFGMGYDGFPAISMTQLAAKKYCEWLSAKTGHYYRLPTEAEWEYACRAGTTTAYSWGDDPAMADEYAWFADNSDGKYQKVGKKKPNPWGLHDMHGNVMEWTLDQYFPDTYAKYPADSAVENPVHPGARLYLNITRGGSWEDDPDFLRSAKRVYSESTWKIQDPQLPKSKWYLTDAQFLGFRVVRPLTEPTAEEKVRINGTADALDDRGGK